MQLDCNAKYKTVGTMNIDRRKCQCAITGDDIIFLRPLFIADVNDEYLQWVNDPKITQFLEIRYRPQTPDAVRSYVLTTNADPTSVIMAICLVSSQKHVGNIKIGPINSIHGFADVSFLIGDKTVWGKGVASRALALACDYAFNTLNLHKLMGGCYENNKASARVFEKCGFRLEGCRNSQWKQHGTRVGQLLFGLIEDDYKSLQQP